MVPDWFFFLMRITAIALWTALCIAILCGLAVGTIYIVSKSAQTIGGWVTGRPEAEVKG